MNAPCSHSCLVPSANTFDCFCNGSDKPIPMSKNNGYCEDNTLIVTYKNYLFVIGLGLTDIGAIIRKNTTLNISSIATVTYNSIEGTLLVTG